MKTEHLLLLGDALEQLKTLDDNSIDSLVTDPPAGISFMSKAWDDDKGGRKQWIEWMTSVMKEAMRVLKPGAHGLVWAIPRTSHWTATALEDAGFEVRDVVTHLFGTGFPKSMDISKAIDKQAGAERTETEWADRFHDGGSRQNTFRNKEDAFPQGTKGNLITKPATPEAKQWQGWGTALKPASEHWILVRKPIAEKTVAANVLKHGTGGINIDRSRIDSVRPSASFNQRDISGGNYNSAKSGVNRVQTQPENLGRFPSNLLLDEEAAQMLDEQSGILHGAGNNTTRTEHTSSESKFGMGGGAPTVLYDREGGASRFFYVAKASKKDKGETNTHPTVKSRGLMTYLIKLITPPNGIVIDPFMGSGSTGVAAKEAGFHFIGIEKEIEYFEISKKRIEESND